MLYYFSSNDATRNSMQVFFATKWTANLLQQQGQSQFLLTRTDCIHMPIIHTEIVHSAHRPLAYSIESQRATFLRK